MMIRMCVNFFQDGCNVPSNTRSLCQPNSGHPSLSSSAVAAITEILQGGRSLFIVMYDIPLVSIFVFIFIQIYPLIIVVIYPTCTVPFEHLGGRIKCSSTFHCYAKSAAMRVFYQQLSITVGTLHIKGVSAPPFPVRLQYFPIAGHTLVVPIDRPTRQCGPVVVQWLVIIIRGGW